MAWGRDDIGGMCILDGNRTLQAGIWGEFRKRVRDFYKKTPDMIQPPCCIKV